MKAQGKKAQVLDRMFQEGVKKAKDMPGKPINPMDLDEEAVAGADLTTALLKRVSRSFYLSLAVLPAAVRPTIGLAYLLARATDTIADTRLVDRAARIAHLETVRAALRDADGGRLAAVAHAIAAPQALPAKRSLLERLPEAIAALRALPEADRARVRAVLETIVEGQIQDLRVFPGEDEAVTRAALERQESRGAQFRDDYPEKDASLRQGQTWSARGRTAGCGSPACRSSRSSRAQSRSSRR